MTQKLPLSYSRLSTFETCPRKFDYLYVSKTVRDLGNEHTIYGERLHEALEKAGRDGDPLPDEFAKFAPLVERVLAQDGDKLFEHQMAVRENKTPCDWFAEDVWIRGIADVLILNDRKAWCLDWKSGKVRDNPTQLQLFSALVFEHFDDVDEVTVGYVWLNYGEITKTTYERRYLKQIWGALEPRFAAVQEAYEIGVFKPKPSGLCRYCPANQICEAARG